MGQNTNASKLCFFIVIGYSCIKFLLLPSYRSSDFEVHRNWLAITYSLPVRKWYSEDTSEWTLDYPPLFAWFEFCLAKIAYYFDSSMLQVENLNYASKMTIVFQRLSVIVTDLLFAYSCSELAREVTKASVLRKYFLPLFIIIFCNAGLLIVDHIHFQYNGFLNGIFLLSVARIYQGKNIEAAFWFSMLLNMKHIFIYISPAYFVYLLRSYCFTSEQVSLKSFSFMRLSLLISVVSVVFAVSFGPFLAMGQIQQVIFRLFPFKRGLSHAYWAPNAWALYNFLDKFLSFAGEKSGIFANVTRGSMTGGLVQEFNHAVLPSVSPMFTLVATFASLLPAIVYLWKNPKDPLKFIRAIILCAFGSFLFGWHVHEKAVLMIIIPLSLLCIINIVEAEVFIILVFTGHSSLFPLIFTTHEIPIKVLAVLLHGLFSLYILNNRWKKGKEKLCSYLSSSILNIVYLFGLIPLFIYTELLHHWLDKHKKYPFMPLMVTSVYCALGITASWLRYCYSILTERKKYKKE